MNFTQNQIAAIVGALHIENVALRMQVAELEQQLKDKTPNAQEQQPCNKQP